jgi:hypothetical protein
MVTFTVPTYSGEQPDFGNYNISFEFYSCSEFPNNVRNEFVLCDIEKIMTADQSIPPEDYFRDVSPTYSVSRNFRVTDLDEGPIAI